MYYQVFHILQFNFSEMTRILFFVFSTFLTANACAQESKNDYPITYEASFNGKTHIVTAGDTVYLGNGSNRRGSFMYIYTGLPPEVLEKKYKGKVAVVYKVIYVKRFSQYQVYINIEGVNDRYIVQLPQAIEKGEIAGFNGTSFK